MVNCIVIDDDQNIVNMFSELLDTINVTVLATGNNGKDAVKLYEKHIPDIVFTDLRMPNHDGMFAVENIKDKNPNSKIIMITGEPNEENLHLLDILNVQVIIKPFNIQTIKQAIEDVLSIDDNGMSKLFKIQYKFECDENFYSCAVTYEQYRNLKRLPIIQHCKILGNADKVPEEFLDEMKNAVELASQNNIEQIHELSEIVTVD